MSATSLSERLGARCAEPLELVDAQGGRLGQSTLLACHEPPGALHRAFSVYLFDADGRLLVHRRAAAKALWGGFWTNSCCSHPRPGEGPRAGALRRVREELGASLDALEPRFEYVYRAEFEAVGVEHEFVHVFGGRVDPGAIDADPGELDALEWLAPAEVQALLDGPTPTTPWFELAWPRLAPR